MSQTGRREKVLAMLGLGLVLFLVSLDQTVVGTAMPQVIAELNGFEWYAWVATAYLLTETTLLLPLFVPELYIPELHQLICFRKQTEG